MRAALSIAGIAASRAIWRASNQACLSAQPKHFQPMLENLMRG